MRLHTPFEHLNPYELKMTRKTLNEISGIQWKYNGRNTIKTIICY